jgi:parvulin-like peptidyl-prolyl isomerase
LAKKVPKPKREVTKRQLARWQREDRRQRIIRALGIFAIIAVLAVVVVGWYIDLYRPGHQTVITVNNTKFNMNYYVTMLGYYGKGQSTDTLYSMADEVVKVIQRDELIRQSAQKLGIEVSDQEVDKQLKSYNPPLSSDYRQPVRTQMLVSRLLDEYFGPKVPTSVEQRNVMAMLLETESQATSVRDSLEAGEDFGQLAAEYSLESVSHSDNGTLGWHSRDGFNELLGTSVLSDFAFSADVGELSQPVNDDNVTKGLGYWIVKVVEKQADPQGAHIQAILLSNHEEATQVKSRLDAGEDFATLAGELSQYDVSKQNGGDLGWLTPDGMGTALSEFVFSTATEAGTLSGPIRDDAVFTRGGYWLIKVIDEDENRQIDETERNLLKSKALDEWVSSLTDNPENKVASYLDADQKAKAIEKVVASSTQS